MEDTRKLKFFERTLGNYEVAGAICSYGDVIDFIDGEKKGILIVDTCGHREDYGSKMSDFLKEEISKGWGTTYDGKTELINLQKKLVYAGTGKEYFDGINVHSFVKNQTEEEQWWFFSEMQYLQLNPDSNDSIGSYFIHLNSNGDQTFGDKYNLLFEEYDLDFNIESHDVVLMASDGLRSNIKKSKWDQWKVFGHESAYLKCRSAITKPILENQLQNVNQIRNEFVRELSDHFLPKDYPRGKLSYDDVTFAIVKRK